MWELNPESPPGEMDGILNSLGSKCRESIALDSERAQGFGFDF